MNALEESFARLVGRQASDKERQDLYRTRDALHLKNNDALWLVLMALGHYEALYARVPAQIAKAAADITERTRAVADAELKAAATRAQADLTRTVARSAREIADRAASAKRWQWIAGCVAGSALLFVLVGVLSYRAGDVAGAARGYGEARNEQAAHAWANTPEGQLAYELAKAGSLRELASCSGRGWVQKGAVCFPKAENGQVFGWNLPARTGR